MSFRSSATALIALLKEDWAIKFMTVIAAPPHGGIPQIHPLSIDGFTLATNA